MNDQSVKLGEAVDKNFVEVTRERFEVFHNSLRHREDYHEGVDVGRTHGCGWIYLGGKGVASWSWLLESNAAGQTNRVWSHKIRADLAPEVPQLIENRYFVIDLLDLTDHQKTAIGGALNLLAIESKKGIFFGESNPLFNSVRDQLAAHIANPLKEKA